MSVIASSLGYPRIGVARELKRALEAYWSKACSAKELQEAAAELRRSHWLQMKESGIDHIPCNDFSLYDHILDMAVTVKAIPSRYQSIEDPLVRYFAMARGIQDKDEGVDLAALEMTKWFDTNYHYIVPELDVEPSFELDASKILAEVKEARALGIDARPVIPGPVTFLLLSKYAAGVDTEKSTLELLDKLLPVYKTLLSTLANEGVAWVQIDEPCLVTELDEKAKRAYQRSFESLCGVKERPKILLATYFGDLESNLNLAAQSGYDALHIDLVRAPNQLKATLEAIPKTMKLSLGLIDGRNIWRNDLDGAHKILHQAVSKLGADRVLVGPSCSLLHVPVDLRVETNLDDELRSWLAFASQKLDEISALAKTANSATPSGPHFDEARSSLAGRNNSTRTRNTSVRNRLSTVNEKMLNRVSPFSKRVHAQRAHFSLPLFPTTTIGSFPQTNDVRGARASWRSGKMSQIEYDTFLRAETKRSVEVQEKIGLDVLVHGEFERNDMVEYFGEKLDGFAFTKNGWVQSYGSRCVKPPVLFGDVSRPEAMTVEWSTYAQSLTKRPMKGMLTGPVTILQWSFVRNDQPRSETCKQIALALRDEVADLEKAGIQMIQVDEPAIREGLPLRRSAWRGYLKWAVDAFRLATTGVRDETQIHTHMCYSEFGDILEDIGRMDADVLSVETSRSKMELLADFARFKYPNEIGPGVYDIHSPRVPTVDEVVDLVERAAKVVSPDQLWVNPDCGLKTRGWPEVQAALINMVEAAHIARERLA